MDRPTAEELDRIRRRIGSQSLFEHVMVARLLAEIDALTRERDTLLAACEAVRPSGCWCKPSRDVQDYGHETACQQLRAALGKP
jgi:hypothetical protein